MYSRAVQEIDPVAMVRMHKFKSVEIARRLYKRFATDELQELEEVQVLSN